MDKCISGFGQSWFSLLLSIVGATFKLCGYIEWSWWLVLLPILVSFVLHIIVIVLVIILLYKNKITSRVSDLNIVSLNSSGIDSMQLKDDKLHKNIPKSIKGNCMSDGECNNG